MTRFLILVVLVVSYFFTVLPLRTHLENRPIAVKLGYTPRAEVLKPASADHELLVAEMAVLKVMFYFGSLVEQWQNRVMLPPEYFNMFKTIETAIRIDPYNADSYYFAQAAFTWEVGRAADVNRLLEYGMKFRTWDPDLPFYAGFNYAFFLNDFAQAAPFMRKAAELSGLQFYANLAARYFYEAGQNDLGLLFLDNMIRRAKSENEKHFYRLRLSALQRVRFIEHAQGEYWEKFGVPATTLMQLKMNGFLEEIPTDPYGGEFFIDEEGKVRTTSKMGLALMQPETGADAEIMNKDKRE